MEIEVLKNKVLGGDWSPATLRALADAQDAAAASDAAAALLRTGNAIRAPRGDACVRAMVSDRDAAAGTADVVYELDAAEATVPAAACSPLLAFEVAPPAPEKDSAALAAAHKDRGSQLFRAKDWVAAAAHYKRCLATLKRLYPPGCGATVLVNSSGALRQGTLTSDDGATVDVMYDDGRGDDDDLDRRRVLAVVAPGDARELQLTTYLNLARCGARAGRGRDAVASATLALGMAQNDEDLARHAPTALVLRARAHLAQKHLKQAMRDSRLAAEAMPGDRNVLALARDVERAKKLALRENKKLARDVTAWVESAQGKFSEHGGNLEEAGCAQQ